MIFIDRLRKLMAPSLAPSARPASLVSRLPWRAEGSLPWYWATPLVAIVVFILMMGAILWWLNQQEQQLRRETLLRDVESAQQTARLRLLSNQDTLQAIARSIAARELDETTFYVQSRELIESRGELVAVAFVDETRITRWIAASAQIAGTGFRREGQAVQDPESSWAFDLARDDRRAAYTRPFLAPNSDVYFEVHVPILRGARFAGVVIGTYSTTNTVRNLVSSELRRKYLFTLLDESGNQLGTSSPRPNSDSTMSADLVMEPPGYGMFLRAYAFSTRPQFSENLMFWLVAGLSGAIVWSLIVLWRHMRRRALAEQAVVQETNFRRAMEDSMSTGMRAIDLQGRITYVNAAFCRMTGFSEADFIGALPPYPYWDPAHISDNTKRIETVLSGRVPPEGLESVIRRRDGTHFDARLYVTPLIDIHGVQTGWMTSITDITEPKRVRENLAAAHHRFTTVLEGLDAAVSVLAASKGKSDELLFANRYYRQLFGNGPAGHVELSGTLSDSGADVMEREVYSATADKWFEVRSRRIEWVDGRHVRMQTATDITTRKQTEEMSRQQQEKVALTSRLITMGEMASSLAHELNQPLTAITNYAMGTVARVKAHMSRSEQADPEQLLPALEKTAAQAQRAGVIIRRIREFVKRSEPNKQLTDIRMVIEDSLGLVEIDATKRSLRIRTELPEQLPAVPIDRIMVEQVLINLLRNGLEAMADAAERTLVLKVGLVPGYMTLDVIDSGTGIAADVLPRLFEPFYSTKTEGMGMGLNICRSIIEFHQGRLWAENNAPRSDGTAAGCSFHVLLPLGKSAVDHSRSTALTA
jgi:PAS domain S-box-containing protein